MVTGLGAVDDQAEELASLVAEPLAAAPLEQLCEARDRPHRGPQVMRRDVGELLQVGVAALELGRVTCAHVVGEPAAVMSWICAMK